MNISKKRVFLFWTLLSVLIGILFFQSMLYYTGGHLSTPTTDYFIFFQYAKQLATGHPFEFNTGDPGTTGATSLLYTAILAVGYIFFKGMWLYVFAFLLGLLLLIGSVYLYFGIADRLFGRSIAFFSSLLFLLSGPTVYNYLGGMDFALFSFLFLAALYLFCLPVRHRYLVLPVVLALLVFTRPEGMILSLLFFLVEIFYPQDNGKFARKLGLLLIPGAAVILLFMLNYKMTGRFGSTSVSGRSLFANYSFVGSIAQSFYFILSSIKGILFGALSFGDKVGLKSAALEDVFFAPFVFFFFIIGICATLKNRTGRGQNVLRIIIGFTLIIAMAIGSISVFSGTSYHRYTAWTYPGIILLGVVGLERFSHIFGQSGQRVKLGFLVLWIFFSALSLCLFVNVFGKRSYQIYSQPISLSYWIDKNLPAQAKIMSIRAALYKYLTNRYLIDFGGTGFKEFTAGGQKDDENSRVVKYLQYSDNLPEYCIINPKYRMVLKEFTRPENLLKGTNSYFKDEWYIYRIDLKGIKEGLMPLSLPVIKDINRLSLIDTVDIGYPLSEQEHKYDLWVSVPEIFFSSKPLKAKINEQKIWDTGRWIMGGEFFEIQVTPGKDLLWVARIKSSMRTDVIQGGGDSYLLNIGMPSIKMKVLVNKERVDKLTFSPEEPGQWQEISYLIPGKYLTTPDAKISIYGAYGSFHHWFYQ